MKRRRREQRCAYCGAEGALTADHVVSRALYPPSKAESPFARITVPACLACNNGWANDEAHFRNVLLLSGDPTPAVYELWEGKARRSFACPDGRKRLRDLIVQMVPVKTPGGDRHMIYPAKDERVLRIVRKIVRGLCHHHGVLSPVHDGQVLADIQRFALPPEVLAEMISAHAEEDIFQYRYAVVDDPEIHSGWLLNFYGRTLFYCIVFRSAEGLRRLEVASRNTTKGETTALNG